MQLMYVRTDDDDDRYAAMLTTMRKAATDADMIFDASAHVTGGHRHIRYVMTDDCQIDVLSVEIPPGFDINLQTTMMAMQFLGHGSTERKYLMFTESDVYCGKASIITDDTPGADNLSNRTPGYARIDYGCWNGRVVAHELVHLLGGVQPSAPNSSGAWHVIDAFDIMTHSDPPDYASLVFNCLGLGGAYRLDCGNDDYFHTSPEPGSYLAENWNVADSAFLDDGELRVYMPMVMQ